MQTAPGIGALEAGALAELIGQLPDGVLVTDRRGVVLLANQAAQRMLSPVGADLAGTRFGYAAAVADRAEIDIEATGVVARMRVRWVELKGRPAQLISLQDVTEQRRAAEDHDLTKALLDQAERVAHLGCYQLDLRSRRLTYTSGLSRIAGRGVEDEHVLADPRLIADLVIHPDDRQRWLQEYEAAITTGVPIDFEHRMVRADGEVRYVRLVSEVVTGQDGRPAKHRGTVQDITEQRRAMEALRESEERFRLLAERSKDVIYLIRLTPPASFEYISPSVETVTGLAAQEVIGDLDRLRSKIPPEVSELLDADIRSQTTEPHVFRYIRPDGSVNWIELQNTPIHDDDGNLVALEGTMRDVTDRVQAEQERLDAVRRMEQSERLESLGQLAGGIAHDFNNLLAVILGTAQLMAEDLDPAEPGQSDLRRIIHTAERGAALTRQLLIFSRREPAQPQVLDLGEVVTRIADMLHRMIGEDIRFVRELQPGLPPVNVDRSRVEQVILNLVVNARAAMPEGGDLIIGTTVVSIPGTGPPQADLPTAPGDYVVLTVTDTGCGMPPEVARRVFEPFFTTRRPGQGTGLGLATVHGVVTDAGGHITLHTRPGQGTTFAIYLPAASGATQGATVTVADSLRGQGETILLVEDEQPVRDTICRILTRYNYRVLIAEDPQDAVRICADPGTTIDALLTDLVMPVMSGSSLAGHLHATTRPGLPVLYMSGYPGHNHQPGSAHVPPPPPDATILRKPFDTDALLDHIHRTLHGTADP